MTDEEAAQLRAQVHEATRVLSGAYTISQVRQVALTEEYAETFAAAVERLLDERATLVEIAREVAEEATVAMYPAINSGNDHHEPWCAACLCIQTDDESIHDADCPVTKARALLGAGGGEKQP